MVSYSVMLNLRKLTVPTFNFLGWIVRPHAMGQETNQLIDELANTPGTPGFHFGPHRKVSFVVRKSMDSIIL